jgi:hypothetical protein
MAAVARGEILWWIPQIALSLSDFSGSEKRSFSAGFAFVRGLAKISPL